MGLVAFFQRFFLKNGVALSIFLLTAVTIWILLMIVLPQLFMLDFSFRFNLPPSKLGGPEDVWTAANYKFLVFGSPGNPDPFNMVDTGVFFRTIVAAIFVTLFDVALCYPIAYYLAQVAKGGKARLLVLALIVPFWVNEILRAFAFRILFGATGVINTFGLTLGLWDEPINFIGADVALYAGLGYAYILLMIFPIFNAIESLDRNQIEAARDLGVLAQDPVARGDPPRQAGNHLGLHHGLHALRRRPGGAADPRRAEQPVVHADHLPVVQHRRQLAARLRLRHRPADFLRPLRDADDAPVQGQPG
jgi:ABC-type spermidine/putrescine transport system permease subunit I